MTRFLPACVLLAAAACTWPSAPEPPEPLARLEPDLLRRQRPGQFQVRFRWEAGAWPLDGNGARRRMWMRGRVEERPGDARVRGRVVGEAAVVELAEGAQLEFTRVDNGADRVVVLDIREGTSADLPVLYRGVSAPFALQPGERTPPVVDVPIVARPAAGDARVPATTRTGVVDVLLLPPAGVVRVEASTAADFPEDDRTRRVSLDGLMLPAPRDGFTHALTAVDVGGGTCGGAAGCERALLVRYVDDHGYPSAPLQLSTRVDGTPPAVTGSVTPRPARGDSPLRVVIQADEPVRCPATLGTAAGRPSLVRVFPGAMDPDGTTCTWALPPGSTPADLAPPDSQDVTLPLSIPVEDVAGNSTTLASLSIALDTHAPVLTTTVSPAGTSTLSRVDGFDTVTLDVTADEPATANATVVDADGNLRDVACVAGGDRASACVLDMGTHALLVEGALALRVVVTDAAGNFTAADATFVLDLHAPAVSSSRLLRTDGLATAQLAADHVVVNPGLPLPAGGVSLLVVADQALASARVFQGDPGAGGVEVPGVTVDVLTARATWRPSPGPLWVRMVDAVGNAADHRVGTVDVDTQGPTQVDALAAADGMVLRRAPWRATARTVLDLPAAALLDGVESVSVHADDGVDAALARVDRAPGGAFPARVEVAGPDPVRAWIRTWDRTGNASAWVQVKRGTWTATPAEGSAAVLGTWRDTSRGEEQPAVHRVAGATVDDAAAEDARTLDVVAAPADRAVSHQPGPRPVARGAMATLTSGGTARTLHVGDASRAETWELQVDGWRLLPGAAHPGPTLLSAMVEDTARGTLVLFGGSAPLPPGAATCPEGGAPSERGTCFSSRTWLFDGTAWRLHVPAMGESTPPAREGHAMALDRTRNVVVMFGGHVMLPVGTPCPAGSTGAAGECSFQDTWEWNGSRWTQPTTTGAPGARHLHAMAWRESPPAVVMHGGIFHAASGTGCTTSPASGGCVYADTWALEGGAWSRLMADGAPGPRHAHGAVTLGGEPLLFGGLQRVGALEACPNPALGRRGDDCVSRQFFRLSGNAWVQGVDRAGDVTTGPSTGTGPISVDPVRGEVLVFQGLPWVLPVDAVMDGGTWLRRGNAGMSPDRVLGGLATSRGRNKVVLAGGSGGGVVEARWEWNGAAWTRVPHDNGVSPLRRLQPAVASTGEGSILLHGGASTACGGTGDCNDTWLLDGAGWGQVTSASGSAPSVRGAASTGLPGGDMLLAGGMVAGAPVTNAWRYMAATRTWAPAGSLGTERTNAAMARDETAGTVVLFGGFDGFDVLGDTWTWNGTTWTEVCRAPCVAPSPRHLHAMAYDPFLRRVVLFGGTTTSCQDDGVNPTACSFTSEAWSFNTALQAWETLDLSVPDGLADGAPPPLAYPLMAFDEARQGLLLYGFPSSTWTLHTTARTSTPGAVLRVDTTPAALPEAGIDALEIASAGAACAGACDGGVAADDLAVEVFDRRTTADGGTAGWTPVACGVDAHPVLLQAADGGLVRVHADGGSVAGCGPFLLLDQDGAASIRAVPRGGPGGRVELDHVELTVRYRRP